MLKISLFILSLISANYALAVTNSIAQDSQKSELIAQVAKTYQASMAYIFQNQPLINQQGADKSQLFGQAFILNVKNTYETKFNQAFPNQNSPIIKSLIQVMIEVMESNRTLLYDDDIAFKGFIPAIFAFQLSEKLSKKNLGVKIKFTSKPGQIRNQLNQPDFWEIDAMNKVQKLNLESYFDDQASYLSKPAQRYFLPVKMQPFCLSCHGVSANNPLNTGKPEAQWSNIDRTGFPMENWTLKDFGGGISITFFDK
jgi:hypothetical protein